MEIDEELIVKAVLKHMASPHRRFWNREAQARGVYSTFKGPLNQKLLAARSGVRQATISRWLSGKTDATVAVQPILLALHLSADPDSKPVKLRPLRAVLEEALEGRVVSTVCRDASVDDGAVGRYLRRERELSARKLSRLLCVLGLELEVQSLPTLSSYLAEFRPVGVEVTAAMMTLERR